MTSIDLLREGGYDDKYLPDQFELPRRSAEYTIDVSVGEHDKPGVALMAQRVHGRSYADFGYIAPEGLAEDGSLLPELDGNRDREDGSVRINYLVAYEKEKTIDETRAATMRLIDIGENGTIEDLPTYRSFNDVFSPEIKAYLHELAEMSFIREAGSLGTTDMKAHRGAYEIKRAAIQNAIIQGVDYGQSTLFLVSMTPKSLRPITQFVGPHATTMLSEPTEMFSDDPRKKIVLQSALIDPHKMIDGILDDIEAATNQADIVKLTHKLEFVIDGLPSRCISDRVVRFLADAA